MIFNYSKITPLEISNSDLDEYEQYVGKSLYNADREAILKFTGFRRALTIRRKLKMQSIEYFPSNDLRGK
ncbi:LIMLP_19325 family protein [Leptospira weilii]|uniref:LIMLP_19325 family protein n=1 Tax=Leptospira weilii TaxID=28184 RepID=UPI0007739891